MSAGMLKVAGSSFGFVCLLVIAFAFAPISTAEACGAEEPCEIADGSYFYMAPDASFEGPRPVLVFFHGHRSSGASVMNSASLRRSFVDAGYVLVAPNGDFIPDSEARAWPARSRTDWRDDVAFTGAVMDDLETRLSIDPDRIYVSGFSAGGSMAWMIACLAPDRYAGFVSVAGALRRPNATEICPGGPTGMLHIHGFADTQVPIEGRAIGDWHQGDVFESLDMLRQTNGCRSNPMAIETEGPFWCRQWTECGSSAPSIGFCLHDGGHGLPAGWADLAKDWIEGGDLTN